MGSRPEGQKPTFTPTSVLLRRGIPVGSPIAQGQNVAGKAKHSGEIVVLSSLRDRISPGIPSPTSSVCPYTSYVKVVAKNRRALFDYEILDTVEAGIQLTGQEVKAARMGHVNLAGSYVLFQQGRPILRNAAIAQYPYATGLENYQPNRDRPLLLHSVENTKLQAAVAERGVALIALEVRSGRTIKVLLGLGRGRKILDKRQRIKEREVSRKLKQTGDY